MQDFIKFIKVILETCSSHRQRLWTYQGQTEKKENKADEIQKRPI